MTSRTRSVSPNRGSLDEALSPIKIDLRHDSTINHKTPSRIVHHPHGLSAKHDARRNTIGNSVKRRGLVNTPLISRSPMRNPITSPRLANRPIINLESIKRSRQEIDDQIKLAFPDENKENILHLDLSSDSEQDYSSPIKRIHQGENEEKPTKIPKIIHEEVEEEEYVKEDFVAQNRSVEEHTRVHQLIKQDLDDYTTPERTTEPVAKSPQTHARVIEDKGEDETSPIKSGHHGSNNEDDEEDLTVRRIENEPTINFLMSPNSKPVFSRDQVNKIQEEHEHKVDELVKELANVRDELATSDQKHEDTMAEVMKELAAVKAELRASQQEHLVLKESRDKLVTTEELLTIQLQNNERELASLTKNFKMKDTSLHSYKRKLNEQKLQLDTAQHENDSLKDKVKDLGNVINDLKSEIIDTNNSNIELTLKLDQVVKEKEELWEANERLNEKLDHIPTAHYEKLTEDYDELKNSYDILTNASNQIKSELEEKIVSLQEINDKLRGDNDNNERLIKEYEAVTHDKITDLENERKDLAEQLKQVREEASAAQEQHEHAIKKLELKIEELEDKTELEEKDKLLEEKDNTINEYLSKLEKLADGVKPLKLEIDSLKKEKESFVEQINNMNKKADEEWDRLSKHLHSAYSEKHTRKMQEAKQNYTQEKEVLIKEKRDAERQVEFLKAQLEQLKKDIKYLQSRLDANS
ncbi:ATG23 Autophagy-related protein 23 [Candida maltosa Xu316]